jgi:hypothetical protein
MKPISLLTLLLSVIFISCKKNEGNGLLPVIETGVVLEVTSDSIAKSGGTITSEGGSKVKSRGVCWSTNRNPTTSDQHTNDGSGAGVYDSYISNLAPLTTYYLRAYATNSKGTSYGTEKTFTTGISLILKYQTRFVCRKKS